MGFPFYLRTKGTFTTVGTWIIITQCANLQFTIPNFSPSYTPIHFNPHTIGPRQYVPIVILETSLREYFPTIHFDHLPSTNNYCWSKHWPLELHIKVGSVCSVFYIPLVEIRNWVLRKVSGAWAANGLFVWKMDWWSGHETYQPAYS